MSYLKGLLIAWVGFVAAYAVWTTALLTTEDGILSTVWWSLRGGTFFGLFFVLVLALITGLVLWRVVLKRIRATPITPLVLGVAICPVHVLGMWLLMRDRAGTFGGRFGAWRRLPSGEWGLWGWPALVGGVVFTAWAMAHRSVGRPATV